MPTRPVQRQRVDGRGPSNQTWRSLQAEVEAGGWSRFLDEAGCPANLRARVLADTDGWIADCVTRASARGSKYAFSGGGGSWGAGGRGGGNRGGYGAPRGRGGGWGGGRR